MPNYAEELSMNLISKANVTSCNWFEYVLGIKNTNRWMVLICKDFSCFFLLLYNRKLLEKYGIHKFTILNLLTQLLSLKTIVK